jgi:cell wall-associated NlpC family hydrolase
VLPHGTGQDSVPGGTQVAEANLQLGDLVFFGPSLANYTHAGVYAGVINGKPSFWSAVTEGIGVALESMAWEERANQFVGATRYWH